MEENREDEDKEQLTLHASVFCVKAFKEHVNTRVAATLWQWDEKFNFESKVILKSLIVVT